MTYRYYIRGDYIRGPKDALFYNIPAKEQKTHKLHTYDTKEELVVDYNFRKNVEKYDSPPFIPN